jgi:hypothetical protein
MCCLVRAISQNAARDRDIRYAVTSGTDNVSGSNFYADAESGDLYLGKRIIFVNLFRASPAGGAVLN